MTDSPGRGDTPDRRDVPERGDVPERRDEPGGRDAPGRRDAPSTAGEFAVPDADRAGPELIGERRGMFGVRGSGDTSGYGGLVRPTELPGGSRPPLDDDDDNAVVEGLIAALRRQGGPGFDEVVERIVVHAGQLTLHVVREHLPLVAQTLRDDPALRFEMSLGASGVHYPDATDRELHVVYPLQSITHNRRVLLETCAPDADPHIPSLTRVYPTTDWHERETYDFFGVIFDGHPSLTRIQMPDDWEGHPQRKDYPLGGIPVQYKGATVPPPDERRAYS